MNYDMEQNIIHLTGSWIDIGIARAVYNRLHNKHCNAVFV